MRGSWRSYVNRLIAAELTASLRYFDEVVQWKALPHDDGTLLAAVRRESENRRDLWTECRSESAPKIAVLLNGNFNHDTDVQATLSEIAPTLNRKSRIAAVLYNPYLGWMYQLANRLGLRKAEPPSTFITHSSLRNIARLAGFEIVRIRPSVYVPWRVLGLGSLVNRVMAVVPLLRWTSLSVVAILRPVIPDTRKRSLTVVIPARNERGNIEQALARMPQFAGTDLEIIFAEGNSTDGTWEEITRVVESYSGPWKVRALKQPGRGKNDAVRAAFAEAKGELLTVLDADLTMPPELLPRFYDAFSAGLGDFVNGSRLVYPMRRGAMRTLNLAGNVLFAKLLRHVLDIDISDALCGTKLLSRDEYCRIEQWRNDFGDFDPFGDFELLFGASLLASGVVEVPIAYRERVYGETNISRFTDGWTLLRMTATALFRLKLGRTR